MSVDASDPAARAADRLRRAKTAWGEAMTAHKMAPPDAGFASRLRQLADAAELERLACEEAAEAGLLWRPIPGAQASQPPYELRPDTGRRGPAELWVRFDSTVGELSNAITRSDVVAVGQAFADLSSAAQALVDAIEAENRGASAPQPRQQAV